MKCLNCCEVDPTTAGGGFLVLLRRRHDVVETIIGPDLDEDMRRMKQVADLERSMIATPPRTAGEIAEALALVRSEIRDGFLQTDTSEEFLGAMVDAAIGYLTGSSEHLG